jgi:hypothetical protein
VPPRHPAAGTTLGNGDAVSIGIDPGAFRRQSDAPKKRLVTRRRSRTLPRVGVDPIFETTS